MRIVFEKLGDAALRPLEEAVVVARDLEWLLPFVVTGDIRIRAKQQIKKATKEKITVGANRIGLQAPRLYTVGCLAWRSVTAAHS